MTARLGRPLAQCRDWPPATGRERMATIYDIRSQINLEDGTVEIPALTDDEAYELFQSACSNDFAPASASTRSTPARRLRVLAAVGLAAASRALSAAGRA